MQKLFQFFYRYRAFIFFVLLEVLSISFIIRGNSYQSAVYFNSANRVSGRVLLEINNVNSYFNLQTINRELADENAQLRSELEIRKNATNLAIPNRSDFLRVHNYKFKAARVINNSTNRFNNYLTLDRGLADSLSPGMGVISPLGVVGKINSCSQHFSTVISLLHGKWAVSAKIERNNIDGLVKWDGKNPRYADMLYVGRHHKVKVNDTIVTSGYNSIYPEGIAIGKVKEIGLDQGKPFYKIRVMLTTDFSKLSYVYIIKNDLAMERDSLERDTLVVNSGSYPKIR